jgi:hypothetical protein
MAASLISIIATLILINLPQPELTAEQQYETITALETDGEQFTKITQQLNLGEPTEPGTTVAPNTPIIVEHINKNVLTIPMEVKYTAIRQTNKEETYLINNVIPESKNKTIWLATITSTFNKAYAQENPDITSVLIPVSTADNIVAEIRLSGWEACSTKEKTATINNVEMHQQEHCMILLTEPEKTIMGLKYVGNYDEENNPYSVIDGKPITLLTPQM